MRQLMIFKQMFSDTQFTGGRTDIPFFIESEQDEESVTSMTEDQAVKWLFHNSSFQQFFIKDFFENAKNVKTYFGLSEPFTIKNKKPGDIDLLLVDPDRPDKSIAFECKKVKAYTIDEETAKVNNTEKIRHGVIQANKYQSLGFHQSYLLIILLDDGRHSKTPNILLRNTNMDQLKRLYEIPWNEPLNNDIGIVFINVNQISGNHINQTRGLGFCIDKQAQPLEQTTAMTNKIKELLKLS